MHFARKLTVAALGAALLTLGCEKNPVDLALEEALDFSGIYQTSNGMTLQFDGEEATIISLGSSEWGPRGTLKVGDKYLDGMYESDVRGTFNGTVLVPKVAVVASWGTSYWAPAEVTKVTFANGQMRIANAAPGHESFTYTGSRPSTPSTPTTPTTPSAGAGTVVLSQVLSGDRDSQTRFTVTVPSGVKTLEVKMENENQWGRNLGDLFVRLGSQPTVSRTPTYSWNADCASVLPNYDTETCTFPRSGSGVTAGTYHVMVFGYHAYYGAKLTVTTWK